MTHSSFTTSKNVLTALINCINSPGGESEEPAECSNTVSAERQSVWLMIACLCVQGCVCVRASECVCARASVCVCMYVCVYDVCLCVCM